MLISQPNLKVDKLNNFHKHKQHTQVGALNSDVHSVDAIVESVHSSIVGSARDRIRQGHPKSGLSTHICHIISYSTWRYVFLQVKIAISWLFIPQLGYQFFQIGNFNFNSLFDLLVFELYPKSSW